jgi:hypothetical protein
LEGACLLLRGGVMLKPEDLLTASLIIRWASPSVGIPGPQGLSSTSIIWRYRHRSDWMWKRMTKFYSWSAKWRPIQQQATNLGNLSNYNYDKLSNNNNFSTTTKSKFNTIDQYNTYGHNQGGSNSRHGSPIR